MRSGNGTKVVLAPSVESLGAVNGLEHSTVDVGVQSDHACVVRRGVSHSLELLSEFSQHSVSFIRLVKRQIEGLGSYGHCSGAERS